MPPLTFGVFNHVAETLGPPLKPRGLPDFKDRMKVCDDFEQRFELPSLEDLGEKICTGRL